MSDTDNEAVETSVETTTIPQAATDEINEPVENTLADETAADEAGSQGTNEPGIDYAAEYERAVAERDNWKQAALDAKDKLKRKAPDQANTQTALSDEDKAAIDIITERVQEAVGEQLTQFQTSLTLENVDSLIRAHTSDPNKQRLIKFHYENTINRTGVSKQAIESDLQNAIAIADRAKILKENTELKTAIANKQGIRNSSLGSNQDRGKGDIDVSTLKFTLLEQQAIARAAAREGMPVEDYIKKNYANLKQ